MSETRDPPIEEQAYLAGVTVVDIGDLRVARGMTRRPTSSCRHRSLVYDGKERRVWCKDCEQTIEAFDAFLLLVERYDSAAKNIETRRERLKEAEQFQARSLAAKEIDKAWRSRNMVPACPHCRNGLFPEDFRSGVAMVDKDFARLRLSRPRGEQ